MGLPSGYKQVEYIESTGTQYIDTGFVANNNTRIVVDCMVTEVSSFPFGVRGASITNGFDAAFTEANQVFYNYGSNYQFANYANVYERMVIDANKNVATFTGSQTVSITLATATFTTPFNMILFSLNENGSIYTGNHAMRGRIYSCQIYDNGTLVRDFVPCKNSSGISGLYDAINGAFYTNVGSGSFTAGPEVKIPVSTYGCTLIDGTAYKVIGGECLVNGTAYNIQKGKTLVNGTVYDVNVSIHDVTIDITKIAEQCFVSVNGINYSAVTTGIGASYGDVITFTDSSGKVVVVTVNGTSVGFSPSGTVQWTIPTDIYQIDISNYSEPSTTYFEVTTS